MPDREKVKERLSYLVEFGKEKNLYTVAEIAQDALALLKEREAAIITTDYVDGFGNRVSHCPSCNSRLVWHQNKNYCGECGQWVKWE